MRVKPEETIYRLCRALLRLRTVNEALEFPAPIDHAVDDIRKSILDLCGVPADNSADGDFEKPDLFVRDDLDEALDTFLESFDKVEDAKPFMDVVRRELVKVADSRN